MSRRSAVTNVMVGAATKAARGLRRDFGEVEQLQVSRKGPADFVSTADHRTEKILYEELSRARPDWSFLMEERGAVDAASGAPGTPPGRWIVDPLDGTLNFLHGLPHFAISIAAEERGQLTAAVVYDPIKDELFWAEKGRGAYVNDARLRVSSRSALDDAVLATGIPFRGRKGHRQWLEEAALLMGQVAGIRRFGSAALDLAYVAAGRYDGYWERNLNPWDVAAGVLLVKEAGGFVTDAEGRDRAMDGASVVCGTEGIHRALLKALKTAGKTASA
ncbi:inositol monophosphatase [Rhodothalassium salexigens]|uniref:inositol monophosphatase family protein n=1 Tax=Rhodothalassium salexigens TaxID=1086 RepID=UPI001911A0FB|nr:inositol monophosphatase family protein [Rhodothalassium salexigens]MBK5920793.1 inositol monophosphatase [Rhodothalassium salexigens]